MKTNPITLFMALCVLSAGALTPSANAADFYIKFDGIDGEVIDIGRENSIEVLAYSFGASNAATVRLGTGLTAGARGGKVNVQDISITKRVDGASPLIFLGCVKGTRFPSVVLSGLRSSSTGESVEYLTIKLTDVIVSSISAGAGGAEGTDGTTGDGSAYENISFKFSRVEVSVLNNKTGQPQKASWDLATNKGG
jgi:type VI secretion system secreted protein Hcp